MSPWLLLENLLLLAQKKISETVQTCRPEYPERIIHAKTIAFNSYIRRNFEHFTWAINLPVAYFSGELCLTHQLCGPERKRKRNFILFPFPYFTNEKWLGVK